MGIRSLDYCHFQTPNIRHLKVTILSQRYDQVLRHKVLIYYIKTFLFQNVSRKRYFRREVVDK